MLGKHFHLIVVMRTANVAIDLLQANDVGILVLDHPNDAFQAVAAIPAADALVNVITQQTHRKTIVLG